MSTTVKIEVSEGNPLKALQSFLGRLLEKEALEALLVPQHLAGDGTVMPMLVHSPDQLAEADPLAPSFPLNAARILSRLTRRPAGKLFGAVLRPCEMRAFRELVKLKQGTTDDLVLIGVDCLGAFANTDYPRFAGGEGVGATQRFVDGALKGESTLDGVEIAHACRTCEHFVPEEADIAVGLLGTDPSIELLLSANTPRGEKLLGLLDLPRAELPEGREKAVARLLAARTACRDAMFQETAEAVSDLDKLSRYLSRCVNCYNCRVACPVCYCKECVFVTDVFDHEPARYFRWAEQRGRIKMPTDTLFFHLTRLAHMSLSCVGCGQCSNACPNGIPVMELFRTISRSTQEAFEYEPGRSLDEPPPLSIFHEKEFQEVTGGKE